MKINTFETKEEWLLARRGKVTGSRLKDVVVKRGNGKKIGFYELIAERLGIPADGENPMDRGTRLEEEAVEKFKEETGKKVDTGLVLWSRDDNDGIAVSPDGTIGKKEALEVKCLSSARHIEALVTNQIPDEFEFQKLQYFIVNDKLEKLYFAFYDPRILAKPFFVIEVSRKDIKDEIKEYLEYQKNILKEVEQITNQLSNF